MSHPNQLKQSSTFSFTNSSQTFSEPTKKIIQKQQDGTPKYNHYNGTYIFQLPLQIDISAIISALATRFAEQLLHKEEHKNGGHLIIQKQPKGASIILGWLVDCLLFLRMEGSGWGYLSSTWGVTSISLKRQVTENRTCIIVGGSIRQNTLLSIQLDIQKQTYQQFFCQTHEATESLAHLSIRIHYLINELFIFNTGGHSVAEHLCSLYKQANTTVAQAVTKYHQKQLTNPHQILNVIIQQSQALFRNLENVWKEENNDEKQHLNCTLNTSMQRQLAFYALQNILCLNSMEIVKQIYLQNIKQQCDLFNEQCGFINKQMDDHQYLDYLQVRQRYRLNQEQHPYCQTIHTLQNISKAMSLREILLIFQKAFSTVKVDCLIFHGGKIELNSMDDLLPIMIFVTARAAVPNFPVYVKMIDDYIRIKNIFELEERVITTLFVAIEDISKKFKLVYNTDSVQNCQQNDQFLSKTTDQNEQINHD